MNKQQVHKSNTKLFHVLKWESLLCFFSVRYGKYGDMISLEALKTCFVQVLIASRQGNSYNGSFIWSFGILESGNRVAIPSYAK